MEEVFARRKEKMQVEGMNHAELAAASESATDADEDEDDDDRSGSGSSSDCYSSSSKYQKRQPKRKQWLRKLLRPLPLLFALE